MDTRSQKSSSISTRDGGSRKTLKTYREGIGSTSGVSTTGKAVPASKAGSGKPK